MGSVEVAWRPLEYCYVKTNLAASAYTLQQEKELNIIFR